jgi:prepilin peptidase dependent protein B
MNMRPLRQSGFTLIELMVSIAIGLFVAGAVTAFFVVNVKSNTDTLTMTRLTQELRGVMELMTRDIRRAGYWADADSAAGAGATTPNPFLSGADDVAVDKYGTEPDNSCITFAYQTNTTAGVQDTERFGFRLRKEDVDGEQVGAVEARTANNACGDDGWENVTDENVLNISQLTFTIPITCVDIPAVTPSKLYVRDVTITLAGQLKNDTAVSRAITETVRIRNDRFMTGSNCP